jgi:hypothetical protein
MFQASSHVAISSTTPIAKQSQRQDLVAKQPLTLKSFFRTSKVQEINHNKSESREDIQE